MRYLTGLTLQIASGLLHIIAAEFTWAPLVCVVLLVAAAGLEFAGYGHLLSPEEHNSKSGKPRG
jgi:hypothetical protein